MKKLFGLLLVTMGMVALVYVNYHAIKDSKPWFRRQLDKLMGTKLYQKYSGGVSRTKTVIHNTGDRVVHIFRRKEAQGA